MTNRCLRRSLLTNWWVMWLVTWYYSDIMCNIMQDQFSAGLLRNFHRKGLPSPKSATPPGRGHIHSLITGSSLHDSSASSKASSLCFSDSSEQAIFKLADSFAKQFFRWYEEHNFNNHGFANNSGTSIRTCTLQGFLLPRIFPIENSTKYNTFWNVLFPSWGIRLLCIHTLIRLQQDHGQCVMSVLVLCSVCVVSSLGVHALLVGPVSWKSVNEI